MEDIKLGFQRDEANGIRQEVYNRTSAQHTLFVVAAAFASAIGALAINNGKPEILLLFPLVLPFLGLLWLGHHITITRLFTYLARIYIDAGVESYQQQELKNRSDRAYIWYTGTLAGMFALFPIAVLIWFGAAWINHLIALTVLTFALWVLGTIFTVILIVGCIIGITKEGEIIRQTRG